MQRSDSAVCTAVFSHVRYFTSVYGVGLDIDHRRNHVRIHGGPIPLPLSFPFPSLTSPSPNPHSTPNSHFLLSPHLPLLPLIPLEIGPSSPAIGGLGSTVRSPSDPSRNRILCILALKDDIWWQQFYTDFPANQRLANLVRKSKKSYTQSWKLGTRWHWSHVRLPIFGRDESHGSHRSCMGVLNHPFSS